MHPIHNRVLDFIAAPASGDFGTLAIEVFRHQFELIAPYRRFCQGHGWTPDTVPEWHAIPPVPIQAFKLIELSCGPVERRFRSSGTTRGAAQRSVHSIPDLRLYHASALAGLRRFLFADTSLMPLLSFIHSLADAPDSSLAQMVHWAMETYSAPGSTYAVSGDRLEFDSTADILRESERSGTPLCLFTTTAALIRFLDHCRERSWSVRLPHGSRVMDTGGSKGAPRPVSRKGLVHAVWSTLAIPGYFCVNEYSMSELSSPLYENVIADRVAGRATRRALVGPPGMRTRVLNPATLAEVPAGQRGLLCHYDLANAGTAVAVLTEDVGRVVPDGLHLIGRAAGSEIRGCSLAWEETS